MKGYFIENGEVVEADKGKPFAAISEGGHEYMTDACLERARDPDVANGNEVFWTKEAADDALWQRTDPITYWHEKVKEEEITVDEFLQLVGEAAGQKYLRSLSNG